MTSPNSRSSHIQTTRRRQLRYELLESRLLLASDLAVNHSFHEAAGPITWFESFPSVDRVPLDSLASVDKSLPAGITGPVEPAVGEWIVQLTDSAAKSLRTLGQGNALLNRTYGDFTIISGLGIEGLLLVRGRGATKSVLESSLSHNENVQSFSLNQLIQGQSTTPNDPEFVAGLMPGLEKIDATNAWDVSRGSSSTVVGVVDGGIDPTHPDLYLNIWINQGELPTKFLDNIGLKLTDIDGDGLVTFYDLNNVTRATTAPYALTFNGFATGPNASFVVDKNSNGRIDAIDLLDDPNWADGFDTDNNGFFDDFFGVNFRVGSGDPFAANNPSDELGHGTHVAGTIGAIGGNATGVVGVNWQTSLMSLRILDNNNQGDSGAAIRAINYAREMRERYRIEPNGRVSQGANVRVLNNSWGQPGGYEVSLETAIQDSTDAGILFVAASGNGNFLGQGVDNDRTPFYPASYNTALAVAASDSSDRPASFSNYGTVSVDLFAPGIGIRSTLPGGGIGSANGTSMASPHVAGTAALIWSAFPEATVSEIQRAIVSTVVPITTGTQNVSTGGRLNASNAIKADVFAPAARLISKQNITTSGGASNEFTVEYSHRSGIATTTIGNDDLIVTRQWGPADQLAARLKANSIVTTATTARATYIVTAPGGTWDPLDFGDYVVSTVAGRITAKVGSRTTDARDIGLFNVRVNDPSFLYVTSFADSLAPGTLRSQIIAANAAAPSPRTIILESGRYTIDIPAVVDPASTFPTPSEESHCSVPAVPAGWSNQSSGDFDISGAVHLIGSDKDATNIDGKSFDRVIKVHPGAKMSFSRVTITGGVSLENQGGGGILSAGELNIDDSIVSGNRALGINVSAPIGGGGIAVWGGRTNVTRSWIDDNESNLGGGVMYCGSSDGTITRSTISNNRGGGVQGSSDQDWTITNSTISANIGGNGAIADFDGANNLSRDPSISANGRFVAFSSKADNLVPGDTNGIEDIFVYDRITDIVERVSVANDGSQAINFSFQPIISADGRFVAFGSYSENFVPGDVNDLEDIFVYDRTSRTIQCASLSQDGQTVGGSPSSISADGRYVTFRSTAKNIVAGDTNDANDIFIYDTVQKTTDRVTGAGGAEFAGVQDGLISADGRTIVLSGDLRLSGPNEGDSYYAFDRISRTIARITASGEGGFAISADAQLITFQSRSTLVAEDTNTTKDVYVLNRANQTINLISKGVRGIGDRESGFPSISPGGRFVAFSSDATNLVPNDTNNTVDIFIVDRIQNTIERVNDAKGGLASLTSLNAIQGVLVLSISDDGRFSTFASDGDRLDEHNPNFQNNIYLLDRSNNAIRNVPFDQAFSTIQATELTIVGPTLSPFAISGSVALVDSLITGTNAALGPRVTENNVLQDPTPGVSLLGPLARLDGAPPIHPLRIGNPAIDAGNVAFAGGIDQLGTVRLRPDIGAVEVIDALVSGTTYVDTNRNQQLDQGETTIPNIQISVQSNSGTLSTLTDGLGRYSFEGILPGKIVATATLPENFTQSLPITQRIPPSFVPNGNSFRGSLSADGRFVAFESDATNLIANDTNASRDLFLYDRETKSIVRVSERVSFSSPVISPDGSAVVYRSFSDGGLFLFEQANNSTQLIGAGDGATFSEDGRSVFFVSGDYFVYDRNSGVTERYTISGIGGVAPNGNFANASISQDGRSIVFESNASNLVENDTNLRWDVFRLDRNSRSIARISEHAVENLANSDIFSLSISADNRFVAFGSFASDLVPNDNNQTSDIFLFDRFGGSIVMVTKLPSGEQANDFSGSTSISADGRFVSYGSDASNLVLNDTNLNRDIFVFDRITNTTLRLNETEGSQQQRGFSFAQTISADGSLVVYEYFPNTNDSDRDGPSDVYVAANPLANANRSRTVNAGDIITDLNLGLVPSPGTISGRVYEDTVQNGAYDKGEPVFANWTIFLDENENGILDRTEISGQTKDDGAYSLPNVPSLQKYSVRAISQSGFEQIAPAASVQFAWKILLPAAGTIVDRDFAIRRVQSTGQSSASAVSGRLFDDRNGNNRFDAGDVPIVNREVYLDATNFGIRDSNEPRTLTDANGLYLIDGLSSRTVAVTTTLDDTLVHVSPLGSQFSLQKYPLFVGLMPFGNPIAIASDDFNSDGFADVAVVLAEANKLSIRLNDKKGGFLPDTIDIDLGKDGVGPSSIVTGQFDNDAKLDVALTAKFSSKVIVLLNLNLTTKAFASQTAVTVGLQPADIVAGQFVGDSKLDLVIVNQGSASVKGDATVQVLSNNGNGVFTAGPPVPTGGDDTVSIQAANFAGDVSLDVAVVNAAPANTSTPNGGVTILVGNGAGGLALQSTFYQTGALPIDSSIADFNDDGRTDLAVANFDSNTISILLGQANGTLRMQTAILGTASGAFDITVGDIDADGDKDVIASNLKDRNISIFRNIGVDATSGDVRFEPLENVGLGQFAQAQRMPLVVGNFDNDTSGPGGKGTLDIVTIPSETDTLHVLKNKLVNGSHRVLLTGTNIVTGRDFIIKNTVLPPSFDDIASPAAISEDSAQQTIQIGGIKKGRATGPALRFTAISSNPLLVASPSISFVDGSVSASFRYTPLPNANGTSVITVRATDAGANQIFDDGDDGIFERSFTVIVLAVNDAPSMTTPSELAVSQKAGPKTAANFVTGISTGGGMDEQNQVLSDFNITADTSFFVVQPSISSTGTLSFTPSPNKSGNVFVTVKLTDNGGVLNGGVDATTNNFVINILPVNDPPSFRLSGNTAIQSVTGTNTLTGFATGFAPGGGEDELSQVVSDYLVSVDSPGLFAVFPSISNDGILRFSPATDRNGIATVTVRVRDNGGTLNGGVDLSSSQNFSITVGTAQSLTLNATELGAHEIAIKNGQLVVTAGGATIRSVPVAELTKVTTIDSNGTKLFEVVLPASNLLGVVRFTGVGNPIELISVRSAVDLNILTSDKLFGIGLIDLRADGANSLAFQASNISALNGAKTLRILMDRLDSFSAPGNWRAQAGRLENGVWVQPFTNAGAKIEVISETPWQNKVNRFDIDGDQALSPLDVLVLVNLINTSTFPNGQLPSRGSSQADGFFDPDGDSSIGPLDVLTVINEINRGSAAGEGENRSRWIDEVMAAELEDWRIVTRNTSIPRLKFRNRH